MIGKTNAQASGAEIEGIVGAYTVWAGETVSAGDFVQFVAELQSATNLTLESNVNGVCAVGLDEERVLIVTCYQAAVVTISNGEMTVGDFVSHGMSITQSGSVPQAVALSSSSVLVVGPITYSSSYAINGVVLTISGTTVTAGTVTTIVSTRGLLANYSLVGLLPTRCFLAYASATNSYRLYGVLVLVTGTTISAINAGAILSTNYTGTTLSAVALSDSTVLVAHSSGITSNSPSSSRLSAVVVEVGGDGYFTAGTDTVLSSTSGSGYSPCSLKVSGARAFISAGYNDRTGWDVVVSGAAVSSTVRSTALSEGRTFTTRNSFRSTVLSGRTIVDAYGYNYQTTSFPGVARIKLADLPPTGNAGWSLPTCEVVNTTQTSLTVGVFLSVTPLADNTAFVLTSSQSSGWMYAYILNANAKVRACPTGNEEYPIVDGIAKTGGEGGESIDVYVPS